MTKSVAIDIPEMTMGCTFFPNDEHILMYKSISFFKNATTCR